MDDKEWWVRSSVTDVLVKMGAKSDKAIPALIQALKDKSSKFRSSVVDVLCRIGVKANKAIPALKRSLKDKDPDVRERAKKSLKAIRGL